jgi:adenosylcobinamide kinase / adenosylcobinamide-phosphate guanylyltransferase
MPLYVLTGGARSGKSAFAVSEASDSGLDVVLVATAERGRDPEFTRRIDHHRAARPAGWRVIEEPVELGQALDIAGEDAFVIVDCLSLWVANLLERGAGEDAISDAARRVAARAAGRSAPAVAVTNEVGLGIVPANPLARTYRDLLGRVNAIWVERAEAAGLVVAGRVLRLEPTARLVGR